METTGKSENGRFQILSLDGGGLKGLFQASFLAGWEEAKGRRITEYFDLITGTSIGGIIALGLGMGFSAKELLDFYVTEALAIFPPSALAGLKHYVSVIRPLHPESEYDLDLGCRLRTGITKATFTQKQLKQLVGTDLEEYRIARGIKEDMEEMHRCWRLKYANTLPFHIHMDSVPSIPESVSRKQLITEAMVRAGIGEGLAKAVTEFTGAITDNRHEHYTIISDYWRISNSEGYARWFEFRMKLARVLLENRAFAARMTMVDQLPIYQWKSPLQRCVQILKRHRDVMCEDNPDSKPISIIITTLAAASYQGETEIDDALERILSTMGSLINPISPRVPNPVNPAEDFADKWGDSQYHHLQLEQNFWLWLEQAKADFRTIGNARNLELIVEQAQEKFGVSLGREGLNERLKIGTASVSVTPKSHTITEVPAKPWCRADD